MSTHVKIVVEKHRDGYVAYPLGISGVVVGQGDTYEETRANIADAIRLHVEDRLARGEPIPITEGVSLTTIEVRV